MLDRTHRDTRRQRAHRYRERQRKGTIVVSVEIDAARLDKVAWLRKLSDRQCADKLAIGRAIAELIDTIAL
jgi:hypothetical protein